jgi:hypothetical protein
MLNPNAVNFCEYTGEYILATQGGKSRTGYTPVAGESVLVFPTNVIGIDSKEEFAFSAQGELYLIDAEQAKEVFEIVDPPRSLKFI